MRDLFKTNLLGWNIRGRAWDHWEFSFSIARHVVSIQVFDIEVKAVSSEWWEYPF